MIRLIGAGLVVLASGSVGFGCAQAISVQCAQLEGLLWALDAMQSEISCRLTPLGEVFEKLGVCRQRDVAAFFCAAGQALLKPPGCTIPVCFQRGFSAAPELRPGQESVQALYDLSMQLGRFELEAQLAAIEASRRRITDALLRLSGQKRERCRSYGTLGLCAGLALAVILL